MASTEVSIKIKDQIGNKIAPKLAAIGESAKAAAPALAAFKKAWQGLDFSGLSGVGLGSVAQQMKRTATEAKKLEIAIERLKQSQMQTQIVTNNYQKSLNSLRIQEQKMAKEGMAKAAATTSQSMSLKNLNQVTNVTAISTSDLTAKQIKSQLAINRLAISNNDLKMSNEKVKMSTIDLQMKQNSLAISANAVVTSTQNVAKSQKQVTTATNAAANSTVSLNKNLNTLTVQETKLKKEGLGAAASQNRLRAAMVGMAQSSNVTATFTSKLSKEEIKRQTSLAKLAKTQTLAKKATVDLAIAKAKLAGAYNRNTVATQKFDTATKKANISVTRLVANIRRMKAAAVGNRGALGGMVSSLRSYVSLGALVGAGGALKGIDSFKRIENQLRGTTDSSAQLKQVTDELFGVAQRSRVPIADLTIAYRRYDNALSKVGMGQKGSLRITETIGKMLSLNGASANESASALLQLSQAFNKGKLDGDEFRSVAELMPQILDAIAKATGKSRKELFKMSKDGEITVDVLIKAFQSLEKPIDELMNNSVRTIGQSFTQLTNKLIYLFGQWDKKTKFTEKLAKILDDIGNNLDYILKSIRALAAGLAASGAASIIGGFFALIISGVGNLALIPGIIGVIVARLVYMGDQIKIALGDKGEFAFVTLTQMLNTLAFNFEKVFKFLADLTDAFFDTFLPKDNLQAVSDMLMGLLSLLKTIANVVAGLAAGIGLAFSNLLKEQVNVESFLVQPFDKAIGIVGKKIFKLFAEIPAFLTISLLKVGNTLADALAPALARIFISIQDAVAEIQAMIRDPLGFNKKSAPPRKPMEFAEAMKAVEQQIPFGEKDFRSYVDKVEQATAMIDRQQEAWDASTPEGVEAALQNRVDDMVQKIKRSTDGISRGLETALQEGAPGLNRFFDDIWTGTIDFTTRANGLFDEFFSNIKNAAFADAYIKNIERMANSTSFFSETYKSFTKSSIGFMDAVNKKINNPTIKAGLNFLVSSFKQTALSIDSISQTILKLLGKTKEQINNLRPDKVIKSGTDALSGMQQQGEETGGALQSIFGNLSNAFQNFVKTGKLSFKELMRSILADLLRLFMNNLFKQLFGGMMGGGGGGGFLSGLLGGGMAGGGSVPIAGGNGSTRTLLPSGFG